jgi:hypothetical protein
MTSKNTTIAVAVLDDYQGAALRLADWTVLDGRAAVTVFTDHVSDTDAVIERLKGFARRCRARRWSACRA